MPFWLLTKLELAKQARQPAWHVLNSQQQWHLYNHAEQSPSKATAALQCAASGYASRQSTLWSRAKLDSKHDEEGNLQASSKGFA